MMENEELLLQQEIAKADAAKRAWDQYVAPVFNDKEAELFEAFKDSSIVNEKDILTIKLQANVLAMVKDHFDSMINTGSLARKQLEDKENTHE